MIPSFMITFREGLEAFLIVGIILAYLSKTKDHELKKYVYAGTSLAVLASVLTAFIFKLLAFQYGGRNEELFEGIVMLFAALVLTSMILWMAGESKNISHTLRQKVEGKKAYGLFALVFVSVFREGLETVLFLGAAALNSETPQVLYGGLLGLTVSLGITYLIFKSSVRLDLKSFFRVSSVFLILFAAGLTAHGVHELQEAAVLPIFIEHVWDINHILDEKGIAGSVLKSLFGYNGNPSLLEVLSYLGYYAGLGAVLKLSRKTAARKVSTPSGA